MIEIKVKRMKVGNKNICKIRTPHFFVIFEETEEYLESTIVVYISKLKESLKDTIEKLEHNNTIIFKTMKGDV